MASTISTVSGDEPATSPEASDWLYEVLDGEHPLAPPSRHRLWGPEVLLGRAASGASRAVRQPSGALSLEFRDPRVSVHHARIFRAFGRWNLEDAGSKNGTFLDGRRIDRASLGDGSVIEVGRTYLLLREGVPAARTRGVQNEVNESALGLATVVPALRDAFDELVRMSSGCLPILLQGETGTGKEVTARAVHALSRRAAHSESRPAASARCGCSCLLQGACGAARRRPGRDRARRGARRRPH